MKIKTAEIQAVTGRRDQYPPDDMKEIAFAGRSNVGKSSLLNLLTGRKKLAKVSGSPGKTRTINFYLINNAFRIVDLPGYGYAKVAKSMSEDWGRMMDEYFQHRNGLVKVCQLVDIRHAPNANDHQMYDWIVQNGYQPIIIATKLDKLKRSQVQKALRTIRDGLSLPKDTLLIPFSAETKQGREEIWLQIDTLTGQCPEEE